MYVVAMTGGIGSGKSAAANYFESLGADVIDTDVISRELLQQGTDEFNKVIDHFGMEILTADGDIDRKQLREIVFGNLDQRKWLELLLHPRIQQIVEQRVRNTTASYSIIVIPLLAETDAQKRYPIDSIVTVEASVQTRQTRVQARDQIDEHLAAMIIAQQTDEKTRRAIADDVIENDSDLAALQDSVRALHEKYLKVAKN